MLGSPGLRPCHIVIFRMSNGNLYSPVEVDLGRHLAVHEMSVKAGGRKLQATHPDLDPVFPSRCLMIPPV